MDIRRLPAARVQDAAFLAACLAYIWAGIDPRLIYHWQRPIFYTSPGFLDEFLRYPGGPADYLYALVAQAYAFAGWGAIVIMAQVAAVAALTEVYFKALAGGALPLVRYVPALLLLSDASLYHNRTPMAPALLLGLALAILFVRLFGRWSNWTALLAVFAAMLLAAYYLAGMAIVFFAPAAAMVLIVRRPTRLAGIACLLLAVALPAAVEWLRLAGDSVSARDWFTGADVQRVVVWWGLYGFYALGTAMVLLWRSAARPRASLSRQAPRPRQWRVAAGLATALPLLGLGLVAAVSYHLNGRDRSLAALDYHCSREDWPAVIDASRRLETGDFNSLTRYEVNLALYEMNRLGDDMFHFPQAGSLLPELYTDRILPHMLRITDLCLRLGRVDDAERFGSEAMVLGKYDPRIYRLMARVNLVKGQTGVARKFLTALSYEVGSGAWARQRLRDLDRDPQLNGDADVQLLRRRMLRQDDVLPVWQRVGKPDGDMERLLLDQLEQDPSNRMAFEFLMGSYLVARNMAAIVATMPRIRDMTGPAYIGSDGRRRTPRHFQEAMAMYAGVTGQPVNIQGLEIQPETMARLAVFKRIMERSPTREAARDAAWSGFHDSYFFYLVFGPGDYR
jgi:hypothetical protein